MNELSTHLVKLDVKTILQNYKRPKFWQKEWLIYEDKVVRIVWHLTSINTRQNYIESEVVVYCKADVMFKKKLVRKACCDVNKYLGSIPINREDYTQRHFENNLLGTCLEALREMECYYIYHTDEYDKASALDDEKNEKLIDIANEFLDDNNVNNSDIREAYIDRYISDNTSDYFTVEVVDNFQYRVLGKHYLLLISYFNDKKKFDEYKTKTGTKAKSIMRKIWAEGRKIRTSEWVEKMKDNLESL